MAFFLWNTQVDSLKNVGIQTVSVYSDFYCTKKKKHFLKYIFAPQKKESHTDLEGFTPKFYF